VARKSKSAGCPSTDGSEIELGKLQMVKWIGVKIFIKDWSLPDNCLYKILLKANSKSNFTTMM